MMFNFLFGFFHVISIFIFPVQQIPRIHLPHIINVYAHSATPTLNVSEPTASPIPTDLPSPTIEMTLTPTPIDSSPPTVVTPSATPSSVFSPTPTPTTTPTVFPTSTVTPTPTPTESVSTIVMTPTSTLTPTIEITPTDTPTATPLLTLTPTLSNTLTPSPTPMLTFTLTPTESAPTATPTATLTPTPTEVPTKIGNDISYPQCGKTLPSNQEFGIVGVNDGIATTTNPCLGSELLWAVLSTGTANQAKVQLYVNTGNPGGLNTASWPQNNTDPLGNTAPNAFGTCDGADSAACAWQYGWNRAVDDVQNKFIPAAQGVGMAADPKIYPWWLDVETVNSWESGSDAALLNNVADLEAMVSYFESKGITIGIYSTSHQWGEIVGSVPSGSNLNGLHSWLPGAEDLAGAQANCSSPALTVGGSVTMTQYTVDPFDYDYSCI